MVEKAVSHYSKILDFFILLVLHFLPCLVESSNQVDCEKYENHLWETDNQTLATCFIVEQTVDKLGYSISSSRDDNITGLWFDHNSNLFFLPEDIAKTFPNLVGLSAEACSLKAIEHNNFRGLNKLKFLWLTENSLEMIPSDTFKDLMALETLYMRKRYEK